MIRWPGKKNGDPMESRTYIGLIGIIVIILVVALSVFNPFIMAEEEFGDECDEYVESHEGICRSFCTGPCDGNMNSSTVDCFYGGDMEKCMETCRKNQRTRCIMDRWFSGHGADG